MSDKTQIRFCSTFPQHRNLLPKHRDDFYTTCDPAHPSLEFLSLPISPREIAPYLVSALNSDKTSLLFLKASSNSALSWTSVNYSNAKVCIPSILYSRDKTVDNQAGSLSWFSPTPRKMHIYQIVTYTYD